MAFKLSKSELNQKQEYVNELTELWTELETAVEVYNSGLEELRSKLKEDIQAFNDGLADAKEFIADIAGNAESEHSDKSERWQEGERGQAAQEWFQEWQNAELSDFDPELPDNIELEIENPADVLDQLQDEANG